MNKDRDGIIERVSYALQFKHAGFIQWKKHDDPGPRVVAEKIVAHLELSGVVMTIREPAPLAPASSLPRTR